jgi:hypothetical protein
LSLVTLSAETARAEAGWRSDCQGGARMSTLQAFLLGGMVAWTPSLVFLACALSQAPLIESDEDPSVSNV